MPRKGEAVSPEMRARISAALTGRPSPNLGRVPSPEHREKLAAANRGKKASEDTRAKMRASQALRPPRSDESKAKQRAAALGRPKSEAARKAMSDAKKGRPGRKLSEAEKFAFIERNRNRVCSAETREKMRQAKLGKPGPWTGKKRGPLTEEWKRAIGEANKGRSIPAEVREKIRVASIGKKHSPERVQRIKDAVAGKGHYGAANNRWGKPPAHGLRIEYAGIIFRSTYEVAFAKRLDAAGIRWEFEPRRFDLGTCTYLPDFYLPEAETYWEVKGWFGPDSQKKIELFRERCPNISLLVATKPVLQAMGAL